MKPSRWRMVPKHDRPIPRKTNALRAGARSALICGLSLLESAGRPQRVRNLQVSRPARGELSAGGFCGGNPQVRVR